MANSLACKCELSLGAFGTPNCQSIMDVAKRIIFVPENRASNGLKYKIDLDSLVIGTSLITDSISGDVLPTGEIKNVEDVRGDSTFQSFNDGSNLFVKQGIRKFVGYFPAVNAGLVKEFESVRGQKMGVMFVDKNGSLIGKSKDYADLLPVSIDTNTFEAKLVKATDSEVQMVMITFEFKSFEKDGDLVLVKYEDLGKDLLDETEFKAPYRGYLKDGSATTTVTTVTLVHYSGNGKSCTITGATDTGSWNIKDSADGANVVITGVAETAEGVYELTYGTQTAGAKLEVDFVSDADFPVKTDSIIVTVA